MTLLVNLIGNLAADPELRVTTDGEAVANFTVMSNERYRDTTTGEWRDGRTTAVRVAAWGQLGENVADSLRRGDPVTVSGRRIEAEAYLTRDGAPAAALVLRADTVAFPLTRHSLQATRNTRLATPETAQA